MFAVCCGGVHDFGEPPNTKRWVRIDIHGQSFLLNQIRKMIGLAVAVYRAVAPRNGIEIATDPQRNFGTPLAPELGLLLSECLYEAYNARKKSGYDELSVEDWSGRIDKFKKVLQLHLGQCVIWCIDSMIDAAANTLHKPIVTLLHVACRTCMPGSKVL